MDWRTGRWLCKAFEGQSNKVWRVNIVDPMRGDRYDAIYVVWEGEIEEIESKVKAYAQKIAGINSYAEVDTLFVTNEQHACGIYEWDTWEQFQDILEQSRIELGLPPEPRKPRP